MGEFAAIAAIASRLPGPRADGEVWIGDDAAVLGGSTGWLLLAADTVVAGVHADLRLTGLDDLGWKAMAASISDIAAMGGDPGHAVVTVTGPSGTDLDLLYDGMAAAASEFGCPIVGGDLTNGRDIVVSVAVTGRCDGAPVLRRGARPGDIIWVTGPLGGSAAGLRQLRAGPASGRASNRLGSDRSGPNRPGSNRPGSDQPESDQPESDQPSSARATRAVEAHARPVPQLAAGRAARLGGATAMIDVSDGFSADLGHIADASGIGFQLDRIPVHPEATIDEALGGGEDFVLVFCAPEAAPIGTTFQALDAPIPVGRCTPDPAERTWLGRPLPARGWEHNW